MRKVLRVALFVWSNKAVRYPVMAFAASLAVAVQQFADDVVANLPFIGDSIGTEIRSVTLSPEHHPDRVIMKTDPVFFLIDNCGDGSVVEASFNWVSELGVFIPVDLGEIPSKDGCAIDLVVRRVPEQVTPGMWEFKAAIKSADSQVESSGPFEVR